MLVGGKMIKDFRKTIKKKKKKNGHFSFFYILQLPHTVIQILKNWPTLMNMEVEYGTVICCPSEE